MPGEGMMKLTKSERMELQRASKRTKRPGQLGPACAADPAAGRGTDVGRDPGQVGIAPTVTSVGGASVSRPIGWLGCSRATPDGYRSLFTQARGALKKELMAHLRRRRGMRRSRHHTQKTGTNGRIVDAVPISERSATLEDRAVPGHWEGDLLFGSKNSQIATLVERQSRYLMLARVDRKDTETVVNALIKHAHKLPHELYKSLTWDRGEEMSDHQRFTLAIEIKVYFCDPQSSWQRGSNENTNGLLRQYLPKGIDLSTYAQSKLNAIARRLNERPRKTLDFETPAQRFHQCVASTG